MPWELHYDKVCVIVHLHLYKINSCFYVMNLEDLRDCKELEFTKLIMKLKTSFFVPISIDNFCMDLEKKQLNRCICLARN